MSSSPFPIKASTVKAIIFDLGNVLLDLDNALYGESWPQGIGAKHEDFEAWVAGHDLWYALETGSISKEEFIRLLAQKLGLSPTKVVEYWNSILLGFKPAYFHDLEVLRKRYPLYVLSNTNEIHIDWVRQHAANLGEHDFEAKYFEQVFYSYQLAAIKPEAAIYRRAETLIGLPPESLLFIDDRLENVLAAQQASWQAIHLPIDANFFEVLVKHGI